MTNLAANFSVSISLVRQELESTLQKAEGYFTQYAEERGEPQLKLFADELNLARGTYKLLELAGPESLCTEMLSLLGDGVVKFDTKLEALGQALISLGRYMTILLDQERDQPILLVPAINLVRKAGNHKPIAESHFFAVNLRPKLPATEKARFDIRPQFAHLRLMYQVGLIRVLRGQEPKLGLKLLQRSISKLEAGLRGTSAWSFWWVAKAAIEIMMSEDYELTLARRMLFGRIDLQIRGMTKKGLTVFTSDQANEILKDLLLIVAISKSDSALVKAVRKVYALRSDTTEVMLKEERAAMGGPDIGAYDSLTKAFQAEVDDIKSSLDLAAKSTLTADGYERIGEQMERLVGVLNVINQKDLAARLKQQQDKIADLPSIGSEVERVGLLAQVADALLQVELAAKHFSKADRTNARIQPEIIGAGHFNEARIVIFDEVESGLALAKRAIASFAETQDKLHLNNIKTTLDSMRGALIFLNEERASLVVGAALKFINDRVLPSDMSTDPQKLEALADALTSIEYYVETLSQSDKVSPDILDLAVKGVQQLGYKI